MLRVAIVAVVALFGLGACATTQPGAVRSHLSGVWEPVEDGRGPLTIQADGTFDFSRTMLPMAGDTRKLRKVGDALEPPANPGYRIEIDRSEFTPTLSYIRMKTTYRNEDGNVETGYAEFHARLAPDGRLLVRAGVLPGADSPPEAVPEQVYQRTGDAPPALIALPPPSVASGKSTPEDKEFIAFGRRAFPSSVNWFEAVHVHRIGAEALQCFLITPRKTEQVVRFLVIRIDPRSTKDDWVRVGLASDAADAAIGGYSILSFCIPEIDPYGELAESRVADLAEQVLTETQKVLEQMKPRGCGLETRGNGTYLGHYIWQKNNALFGAWFCWTPDYFEWYSETSETNLEKPALFPSEREDHFQRKLDSVVATYQERGYCNVRVVANETNTVDWNKRLVERLMTAATVRDSAACAGVLPAASEGIGPLGNDARPRGTGDVPGPAQTEMVFVPAGPFRMGDPAPEGEGGICERPPHTVQVSAFSIDKYEVTDEQYAAALNWARRQTGLITMIAGVVYEPGSGTSRPYCSTTSASTGSPDYGEFSQIIWDGSAFDVVAGKGRHPMVQVTWYGAAAYCNWRSAMEGRTLCFDVATWTCDFTRNGFRLPTEAEWEKAAGWDPVERRHYRFGEHTDGCGRNCLDPRRANYDGSGATPVGYYDGGVHGGFLTQDARSYYGCYDMSGNVWEWCYDWHSFSYYESSPTVDPTGPTDGIWRALRGGSWATDPWACRASHRAWYCSPSVRSRGDYGFRCALGAP